VPFPPRPVDTVVDTFAVLPDPGLASTLDELVERLRMLKVWAGDPSYEWIKDQVNAAWTAAGRPAGDLAGKTTVVDCFRPGRRRLNADLVIAVVRALHPDVGYVTQWRQALRVIGGETRAASQVQVEGTLPQPLAGFTGRAAELDQLRQALHHGYHDGGAVVISAIAGMAGVGKTQLAIHAAHLLARDTPVDRVLFVNLRGFHPNPAQPPADPAAVLDGFLRLLGVPGQQVPHTLPARTAAYRDRLAGSRTLIVLDNAADEDQVRPLLPETTGCPVLVTSRRSLTGLRRATHLRVDVFTPHEALEFLTRAAAQVPVGNDPHAATRIARRCGHLPLALGLVTGHIRAKPGWTLSDHADRLDERHRDRRLDTGVELALDLSYRQLPADRQRLLRLAALHPGQDLDAYAAAALTAGDLPTMRAQLADMYRDHLLQRTTPDRYTFHDLVRAYASGRASDEDTPAERRVALTRLFDYYLATAATAMDTLYPAETRRRPDIHPPGSPTPALTDQDAARAWLDAERPTLVAVAAHTADHGWPGHTIRLSTTLYRYLNGGHHSDALAIHGQADLAAQRTGDLAGQAHVLINLGATHIMLGRHGPATDQLQRALALSHEAGDPAGQARALTNLAVVEFKLGRYEHSVDLSAQSLPLYRRTGDRASEARILGNLGVVETQLSRYRPAADHFQLALTLFRQTGDHTGECWMLNMLGEVEGRLGRHGSAAEYLQRALTLSRRIGDRTAEGWTLDSLGTLHTRQGRPAQAAANHRQALAIFHETGEPDGEASTLNGLGVAAHTAGHATDALTHHTAAYTLAAAIDDRYQQARAHTGLGHAHHSLGSPTLARQHYQHALTLYTDLGISDDAGQARTHLATIDDRNREQR
jgi:tetratricopeptide (TPR) repeat protein